MATSLIALLLFCAVGLIASNVWSLPVSSQPSENPTRTFRPAGEQPAAPPPTGTALSAPSPEANAEALPQNGVTTETSSPAGGQTGAPSPGETAVSPQPTPEDEDVSFGNLAPSGILSSTLGPPPSELPPELR